MKNLFILLFIFIGTFSATAQYSSTAKENYASRYGIKISGGAILTRPEITYIGNEQDYIVHEVALANSSPQFSAGLWGQKRFGWLYAEANVLYSSYGMSFDVSSYSPDGQTLENMTEKFAYVDLQVMGGLISNGFRIGVGPVMHVLANHDSELDVLQNYSQKLRKISYGFSGAIGYDLGRFSFDLKYDKAFRTVGDHIYYGNKKSQFLETPDALSLAVAYAIF
jgi:hypothetical protein